MPHLFTIVKHCWIFHLYFQLAYLPEETCFQKAGSSAVEGTSRAVLGSSLVQGTSQPITISKKWKNPSFALPGKKTWVQALPWFLTCSLSLPTLGTDLKSREGLTGPSPIHKVPSTFWDWFQFRQSKKERERESQSKKDSYVKNSTTWKWMGVPGTTIKMWRASWQNKNNNNNSPPLCRRRGLSTRLQLLGRLLQSNTPFRTQPCFLASQFTAHQKPNNIGLRSSTLTPMSKISADSFLHKSLGT